MADTPEQVIMELRNNLEREIIQRTKRMRSEITANTPVRTGFLKSQWFPIDFKRHNFGRSRDFVNGKEYQLFANKAPYGQYVVKLEKVIDKAIKRAFSN